MFVICKLTKVLNLFSKEMAMKKISLILFVALCGFVTSGYAACGPQGCGAPEGNFVGGQDFAAPQEANPACQEFNAGECYCLMVRYEPKYCNKWRCEWDTKEYQVRRCRMVPETYQKTCCRMVPQYYTVDCQKMVPQYYCTTETKQVPRYVCDRQCSYTPKYYYKRVCTQQEPPCPPASYTIPNVAGSRAPQACAPSCCGY